MAPKQEEAPAAVQAAQAQQLKPQVRSFLAKAGREVDLANVRPERAKALEAAKSSGNLRRVQAAVMQIAKEDAPAVAVRWQIEAAQKKGYRFTGEQKDQVMLNTKVILDSPEKGLASYKDAMAELRGMMRRQDAARAAAAGKRQDGSAPPRQKLSPEEVRAQKLEGQIQRTLEALSPKVRELYAEHVQTMNPTARLNFAKTLVTSFKENIVSDRLVVTDPSGTYGKVRDAVDEIRNKAAGELGIKGERPIVVPGMKDTVGEKAKEMADRTAAALGALQGEARQVEASLRKRRQHGA